MSVAPASSDPRDPLTIARLTCSVGAVALGLVTLSFGALALQYQPAPAVLAGSGLFIFACACAFVLLGAGVALAVGRFTSNAALVLALWYLSWVVVWHALRMPWHDLSVGRFLPGSEVVVVAAGPALLVAREGAPWKLWDAVWLRLFAAAQVVFGACHFVFIDITASMVPSFLPEPRLWAAATGVAHLLAAVSLAAGYGLRLTGALLCAMYLGFMLMVCAPLLVVSPGDHLPWLMTIFTGLHAAAAWIVRGRATSLEETGLMRATQRRSRAARHDG